MDSTIQRYMAMGSQFVGRKSINVYDKEIVDGRGWRVGTMSDIRKGKVTRDEILADVASWWLDTLVLLHRGYSIRLKRMTMRLFLERIIGIENYPYIAVEHEMVNGSVVGITALTWRPVVKFVFSDDNLDTRVLGQEFDLINVEATIAGDDFQEDGVAPAIIVDDEVCFFDAHPSFFGEVM